MLSMVEISLSSAREDKFICCQCIFAILSLSFFGSLHFKQNVNSFYPKMFYAKFSRIFPVAP